MISYTKNIEQENEFIQSSISIDSNTEENNILLTNNFPSDETIYQDSIIWKILIIIVFIICSSLYAKKKKNLK